MNSKKYENTISSPKPPVKSSSTLKTECNRTRSTSGTENPQNPCDQKPPKVASPYGFPGLSKIKNKIWKSGSLGPSTSQPNSSKFYLNDDKPNQPEIKINGINHSISLNLNYNDNVLKESEQKDSINQKLNFLSDEERIEIQSYGLTQIKERVKLKIEQSNQIKEELSRLKNLAIAQKEQLRGVAEIEALKNEIRNLTNEKARLESLYKAQSNWVCVKCTYSNLSSCYSCAICETERQDDENLICEHCSLKNPLSNLSCNGCNQSFNVEAFPPQPQTPSAGLLTPPIFISRDSRSPTSSIGSNSNRPGFNRLFSKSSNLSNSSLNNNSYENECSLIQPSIPFIPAKNGRYS